jgi:hypothetical protein
MMRGCYSCALASCLIFGVAFQSPPSTQTPTSEGSRSQIISEWQLQKLDLVNLGQSYETIPFAKAAGDGSQLQFTLKFRVRLQNISKNHILALDTNCFRLVKTVVFPEPLVGATELPKRAFTTNVPVDACKNLGLPRKIVRVMPGESYEMTEQLKFAVLDDSPADLSESINPGVYYLLATIILARNWDIDKQTVDDFFVSSIDSSPMKFTVNGKPKHT